LTTDQVIAEIAARQEGRVSRGQLLDAKVSRREIESRIASGHLIIKGWGVYAVGSGHSSLDAKRWEMILAGGPDSVLAGGAALRKWGAIRYSQPIEIIAPRRVRKKGVKSAFVVLPDDEKTECDGMPITTVNRALLDSAGTWKPPAIARALNQAEADQLYDYIGLATLLERYPKHPGAATIRTVLEDRDPATTRSVSEDVVHDFLVEHGFPRPAVNHRVLIGGEWIELDFAFVDARVDLEADSKFHRTQDQIDRDDERDAILQANEWAVVRVTQRRIRREPERVAALVWGALRRPRQAAA
jgi:very-short-patch-repair endonuclease